MFLVEARDNTTPVSDQFERVQILLRSLEQKLVALITTNRGSEKEAKAWLINTVAGLRLKDARERRRRLAQFLPGGSAFEKFEHDEFGKQLLQGLFLDECGKVSRLIAREPTVLKKFFLQDDTHVRLWFGHFNIKGLAAFKHGAASLARYALVRREEAWRHLVWAGKHPQAPVAVAQKPHYFCELDVVATVHNLAQDCPQFWESEELQEGLLDGQLLALAPGFWAKELYGWLLEYSPRSDRLFELVCDYVETWADWGQLCGRLLHLLSPKDLLRFANGLLDSLAPPPSQPPPGREVQGHQGVQGLQPSCFPPGAWLVFRAARWPSLEQLVAASAVACSLRQLGRWVQEAENSSELQEMQKLSQELLEGETPTLHWHLRRQLAKRAMQLSTRRASPLVGRGEQKKRRSGGEGSEKNAVQRASPTQGPVSGAGYIAEMGGGGFAAAGKEYEGCKMQWQQGGGLQLFLLLHLWAGYIRLLQLAEELGANTGEGRNAAVEAFQRQAELAGLVCHAVHGDEGGRASGRDMGGAVLMGEAGGRGDEDGKGVEGRGDGSQRVEREEGRKAGTSSCSGDSEGRSSAERSRLRKRKKHWKTEKKGKKKKKKEKKKSRRKRRGWDSSDSEGSTGTEGLLESPLLESPLDRPQNQPRQMSERTSVMWRIDAGQGSALLTSVAVAEVAMAHVASCYAAWCCQQGM